MSLSADIAAWDQKSSEYIQRIYRQHSCKPSFGPELVALVNELSLERGVSWLLKRHLETGWPDITAADIALVYACLPRLQHWEARLHLLQCLPHLPISRSHAKLLEQFLGEAVSDEVKFVRAWGYNGWYLMAKQHSDYQAKVSRMLVDALKHETAASVKVRIRKALEAGF